MDPAAVDWHRLIVRSLPATFEVDAFLAANPDQETIVPEQVFRVGRAGGESYCLKFLPCPPGLPVAARQVYMEVRAIRLFSGRPGFQTYVGHDVVPDPRGAGVASVWLATRWNAGLDLRDALAAIKPPNPADPAWVQSVRDLVRRLAHLLQQCHRQQLVHRDLKPENIMVPPDGDLSEAVLLDFGIATATYLQPAAAHDQLAGTVDYMPPEAFGEGTTDPSGDVYMLGIMLYEMLDPEDLTPYRHRAGEAEENVAARIRRGAPRRPFSPAAPRAAADLYLRMTDADPTRRCTLQEVLRHPFLTAGEPAARLSSAGRQLDRSRGRVVKAKNRRRAWAGKAGPLGHATHQETETGRGLRSAAAKRKGA